MGASATRTIDGVPIVRATAKPYETTSVFMGRCDCFENGIGEGNKISFEMTAQDTSKIVTLVYNEVVHLKNCNIYRENAPFGASIDCIILNASNVPIFQIAHKIPIWGSGNLPIVSDDSYLMPSDYKLQLTLYNGVIQSAFNMTGYITMFRATTV